MGQVTKNCCLNILMLHELVVQPLLPMLKRLLSPLEASSLDDGLWSRKKGAK